MREMEKLKLTRIIQLMLKYQFMLISRITKNLALIIPKRDQENRILYVYRKYRKIQ
jgi:hypothetical protein